MSKQTVGLVFGGANSEHEVSCDSARAAWDNFDRDRFVPVLLGIDRSGFWHRVGSVDDLEAATGGSRLPALEGIDIVLPYLHGRFGEDGTVQGLLELAGVPYVGNGVLASALAMDKLMCQRVLSAAGIPTIETVEITAADRHDAARRAEAFGFPLFVKPNRAGSSVGVSRVDSPDTLDAAIDVALASDSVALIQPRVDASEVDLGVLQGVDGELLVGAPLRILPGAGSTFFDYASKYTDGSHDFEIPARLSEDTRSRLESFAAAAFRALDCEGLARVDFFVSDSGDITLNEVNTLPGMTALSQFPSIWAAAGVGYRELLNRLIDRALVARPAR